ncbi:MAG: hypothetical protein ABL891_17290 [Burkholderiales bacterium]
MEKEQEIVNEAIKRNRSLYRVAKLCDVTYSTAHKWKKGTAQPRSKNLLRLIELAGKTVASVAITCLMLGQVPETNAAGKTLKNNVLSIHYTKYMVREHAFCVSLSTLEYAIAPQPPARTHHAQALANAHAGSA